MPFFPLGSRVHVRVEVLGFMLGWKCERFFCDGESFVRARVHFTTSRHLHVKTACNGVTELEGGQRKEAKGGGID